MNAPAPTSFRLLALLLVAFLAACSAAAGGGSEDASPDDAPSDADAAPDGVGSDAMPGEDVVRDGSVPPTDATADGAVDAPTPEDVAVDGVPVDAPMPDVGPDTADAPPDLPVAPDAPPDLPVAPDAPPDLPVALDAMADAAMDAAPDVMVDRPVTPDAMPEAGLDATPDAAPDAAPDRPATPDATVDVGLDATPDVAPDRPVTPDVGPDAAPDVPGDGAAPSFAVGTLNVLTHQLSGRVTLNGMAPMRTCTSASPATLRFVDGARGYNLAIAVTCDAAFTFAGQVYPGTYRVTAVGTTYSNLPRDSEYVVDPAFVVGADRAGLVFDVRTHNVSGRITLNGAMPTRTCTSASPATVRFVDATRGYNLALSAACDAGFSFTGQLYPGTYRVTVVGTTYSNLPRDSEYVVDPAFVVGADRAGLAFDVRTHNVSGRITLNGAMPTRTCTSASPATVRFVDATRGYNLALSAACDAGFSFTGQLYPGTYRVTVVGTTYSNLPRDSEYVVDPAFVVGGDRAGLAFDVRTHQLSGRVTLNGVAPMRTCTSASPATLRFVDAARGYNLAIAVTCDAAFTFAGQVYPGTYRVTAVGTTYSNLPRDSEYVVDPAFVIGADRAGLVFDVRTHNVSGRITLNGAPPTRTCTSASPATVRFVDATRGYNLALPAACDTAFSFTGQVYPGTYRVTVVGTTYSNLPRDSEYVVDPAFVVGADRAALAFDVRAVLVSGTITLNGMMPARTCTSASPATVRFVDASRDYDLTLAAACDAGFSFAGLLYPGTYRVSVVGTTYSNLPRDSEYVALPALVVP